MKKLYGFLRILLWCFIGVFLGSSLYQYLDYKAHPGLYEMQSAPVVYGNSDPRPFYDCAGRDHPRGDGNHP